MGWSGVGMYLKSTGGLNHRNHKWRRKLCSLGVSKVERNQNGCLTHVLGVAIAGRNHSSCLV